MTRTADPLGALVSENNHRGGPVSRPARTDPIQRHRLRDVSEMLPADEAGTKLNIPASEFPEGYDLIWAACSIYGQPQPDNIMAREKRGFVSVWGSDFDGKYKHFVPPGGKMDEPIVRDGLMLMARDARWSARAREEDKRRAAAPVLAQTKSIQSGQIDGLGGFEGRAMNVNGRRGISKTVEPLDAGAIRDIVR